MRHSKAILVVLTLLIVISSACTSKEETFPTTTSKTLPFTKAQLEAAVRSMESYEYTMEIKTYNGTNLAATLYSEVLVNMKNGSRASVTKVRRDGMVYSVYYYSNGRGKVTLTNRSGTISWEFSCDKDSNRTLLESLWDDFPLEKATVKESGGYYFISVNTTVISETEDGNVQSGEVRIKLDRNLVPIEIVQRVYYKVNEQPWTDEIRIEIRNVNSTVVRPPDDLVKYLESRGINLNDLLGEC